MQIKEYVLELAGKKVKATFTDLAEQAHGSVMMQCGETIVLATACMSRDRQDGLGFFNLTVDYIEKFYASGKISGSRFVKREGKPSEDAILASRVIDRTLRPLFEQSIRHAVQVIVTVISVDENDPVILAINAASLALSVSNIPWAGPVGAVRIGKYDTENLLVNAPKSIREDETKYKYDLVVCGKDGNINMIEASAHQTKEDELELALMEASKAITLLENFQKKIAKEMGKEKRVIEKETVSPESVALFNENILPEMKDAIFDGPGKKRIDELHTIWNNLVKGKFPERENFDPEDDLFDDTENEILHESAIKEGKRADGRAMDEVRDLFAQAGGLSSVLHGSGKFSAVLRGRNRSRWIYKSSRSGPRRARRKSAPYGSSARRRFSIHYPRGFRIDGIQRLHFASFHLRFHSRAHGRRCANQSAGSRNCDGANAEQSEVPRRRRGI